MASFHARNGAGELLARYSFLEPLLDGSRVLEIGAAWATEGASAQFLAERGAAAVLSIEAADADLEAARRAVRNPRVQFRAATPAELRPGSFDLVLVADGAPLGVEPGRVAPLAALLAPGGRLVAALPAVGTGLADLAGEPAPGDLPDYEQFVGALADHFPVIEVATQSATVGWVLALAGDGAEEPNVSMDGSLAGTPETATYVAVCGAQPCGLQGLTLVALPVEPLLGVAQDARDAPKAPQEAWRRLADSEAALSARLRAHDAIVAERDELLKGREAARAERDEAVSSREAALAALADALAGRAGAEQALEEAVEARTSADSAADRAGAELAAMADRVREIEALLEAERKAGVEGRAALDRLRASEADRTREAKLARDAMAAQADAAARAGAELAERREAAIEAEAALRAARAEAQAAKAAVEATLARAVAAESRLAEVEEALEQRGHEGEQGRAQAEAARAEAERARAEAASVRAEAASAREAADAATAEAARLAAELEAARALSGALAAAEAERDAARASAEAARGELERIGAELERVQDAAREKASLRAELELRIAEIGARVESEEERARAAEAEAARRAEAADAATAEAAKLREALAARAAPADGGDSAERIRELEARLADALRRAADSEAAARAAASATPGEGASPAEGLARASQDRDPLAAQLAERDQRIARLQREVGDKNERLGRLAKELGELKARGLGKLLRGEQSGEGSTGAP